MACFVDETVDSPLTGGLATQTATPDPVSPALDPVLAVSRGLDPEYSDGFPSIEQDPGFRDGLPCIEQDRKVRDEFPRSEDLQGQAHSEGLNSTSDIENTAISRISRIAEKSERLRQSDFRSSNRARQSQPIRAERSSNGSVAGGYESIEEGNY